MNVINRLGAIATRGQLVSAGFTSRELSRAVTVGSVKRIRRGLYATGAATPDQVVAVRVGGRLTGVTAARTFGLWSGDDRRVHVALQRGASRLRAPISVDGADAEPGTEVVLHWVERGGVGRASGDTWRVSLPACLRSVVAYADRETALACVDTAVQRYGLSRTRLDAIFADEPLRSRLIVRHAHGGCDSGLESLSCQRFRRVGLPVRHQVHFRGIRHVDLVVGRRVIVELDGRGFHDTSAAFTKDRRGDAQLIALGYVVLRFSYSQVMFEWDYVERTVLAAVAAHP